MAAFWRHIVLENAVEKIGEMKPIKIR